MFKATIVNQTTNKRYNTEKKTEAEAQAWIDETVSNLRNILIKYNRGDEVLATDIVDISAQLAAKKLSNDSLKFLKDTDYKILRHVGQKALSVSTTMTEQEYLILEAQRQQARLRVID